MAERLRFDRKTLTGAGTRDPIFPVIPCTGFSVRNTSSSIVVRLWDAAAGGQWIRLGPGVERGLAPYPEAKHPPRSSVNPHIRAERFMPNEAAVWAEPETAGTPELELIFFE